MKELLQKLMPYLDIIGGHVSKYKNIYHQVLGLGILVFWTWAFIKLNVAEIDGKFKTATLLLVPGTITAGVCEKLQQILKQGNNSAWGIVKNSIMMFLAWVLCLIFGADNFFELIKMIF